MTRIPWSQGKALIWDVTVVDTLARSNIELSSRKAGSAAEKAEDLKKAKYVSLSDRYIFKPIGLETLGSWGTEATSTVKVACQTGESRSTYYLKQGISIELQRGNASSILGTFQHSKDLDEIFYILRSC